MLNKIYEKVKEIIKNNLGFIFCLIMISLMFYIELPYYINAPGGLIDVSDKVEIDYEISGSYNMTYVTEYKANLFNYIIAKINKNWDLEKKSDVILSNETEEDFNKRNHLLLDNVNQVAVINAYKKAGKDIIIKNTDIYVTYVDELSDTNLEVGDKILEVDGISVSSLEEITNIVNSKEYKDVITIQTDNGLKEATIINFENNKKIGISLSVYYEIDEEVEFKFKNNESGSSGGLMTTLYIYNSLIDEDLTRGRIIAGTGTIDINGNVGEISGVKYKIKGAVNKKADIFFVPKENYEEAISVKNENNYDIDVVLVNTLEEAINYLKNS